MFAIQPCLPMCPNHTLINDYLKCQVLANKEKEHADLDSGSESETDDPNDQEDTDCKSSDVETA